MKANIAKKRTNSYFSKSEVKPTVLESLNYVDVKIFRDQAPACAGGTKVCEKLLAVDVTAGKAKLVCGAIATANYVSPPTAKITRTKDCPNLLRAKKALKEFVSK